ncbi:MAG: type I secretion system permease/ATPase [Campylobacterales bacterium]
MDSNFQNKEAIHYNGDPVLDSLAIFCKINGRPYSKESLIAGLPIEDGKNSPTLFSLKSSKSLFSRAATKAGFKTRILKTKLEDINTLLLPAIVLLKPKAEGGEAGACILLNFDDEMKNARLILPEAPDLESIVSIEELNRRYLGFTVLLKKQLRVEDGKKSHTNIKESHWFWGTVTIVKDVYRDVIIASFMINLFVLATPLFTMNVYDRVIPNNATQTLWVLAIAVLFVYVVDVALKFLRSYFLETAGKKTDIIASSIIFERVMDLRMSSLPGSVGSLANIIKEFESIRAFLTSSTISLLIDLPFVVIFLLVIYYVGGVIALIPLGIIIIILLYTYYAKSKLGDMIKETYGAGSNKNSVLIESLSSIETLKSISATGYMQWNWEEATADIADKSISTKTISASITTITSFLVQLNTVLIIIAGVYLIQNGDLTMGGLIATVIIGSRTISPMGQVASLLATYEHTKASYSAIDEIMNLPVEHPQGKKFVARPEYRGDINIRGLNFTYPGSDKSALNNINIEIKRGEKVAFIGKIGSGKSTMLKLLNSLYYPDSGSILVDKIDIKQIDPTELRKNIAYVSQDTVLFNGTVRDNVVYRAPHSDDEDIIKVSDVAGVLDFINKHPKGFDMPVGERGFQLSGGQKQSVGIARAFLLDSPIVLMDEPTSAMDSTSEALFITKVKKFIQNKTVIISTHKSSLLQLVDRVIVLDEGRVVMDGPKEEILERIKK